MRRTALFLLLFLLCSTSSFAQSGRKGTNPRPAATPIVTGPQNSPEPPKAAKELPLEVDGERIYKSRETDERFQILKKPDPSYTSEARRQHAHGYVLLRMIFAADETVKHIQIVAGLPYGLTERSMQAAQQIKFKPAKKDGKPVSVWVEVEYRFEIF
jgi:TonB family protein